MRLSALTFGLAFAALLVFTGAEAVAAVAGLAAVALLAVLGYRDGSWRALRFAALIPAAAIVADVVTFTPLTLQTGPEATLYTYAAVLYLPAWALLVLLGLAVRRITDRRGPTPAGGRGCRTSRPTRARASGRPPRPTGRSG